MVGYDRNKGAWPKSATIQVSVPLAQCAPTGTKLINPSRTMSRRVRGGVVTSCPMPLRIPMPVTGGTPEKWSRAHWLAKLSRLALRLSLIIFRNFRVR